MEKIFDYKARYKDMSQEQNQKENNPNPHQKVDNSAWKLEEPYENESLEDLLSLVETRIDSGGCIDDILERRYLPEGEGDDRSLAETGPARNAIEYIRNKTTRSQIGIRHLITVVHDAIFFITRSHGDYPGKAVRLIGVVETVMVHYGLHGLDMLLSDRSRVVAERLEVIRLGGKEKRRRGQPPPYGFVMFTDTRQTQVNITCLSQRDYARASRIAEDYGWTLGFVMQVAMVIAVAGSERLPADMVEQSREEVIYFQEYLDKYY